MNEKIRVVVVDDHALLRAGLVRALALDPAIEIVGEGATASDAIDLVRNHAPDLILLDISMPGNGIEAARAIRNLANPPHIVMLTVSAEDDDVIGSFEAGAAGYILKGSDATDIIMAVASVNAGQTFVSPDLALRLISNNARLSSDTLSSLSELEERILFLISEGLTARKVSEQLGLSDRIVDAHLSNILRKFNARPSKGARDETRQVWGELDNNVKVQ